jgi:hypothetical protein
MDLIIFGRLIASVIYNAYTSFPCRILVIRNPIANPRRYDQLFELFRTNFPFMRHLILDAPGDLQS